MTWGLDWPKADRGRLRHMRPPDGDLHRIKSVMDLELGLVVRETAERLQNQDLEHHHRIRAAALGAIGVLSPLGKVSGNPPNDQFGSEGTPAWVGWEAQKTRTPEGDFGSGLFSDQTLKVFDVSINTSARRLFLRGLVNR